MIQLGSFLVVVMTVIILMFMVSNLQRKLEHLKTRRENDCEYYSKWLSNHDKAFQANENSIAELNRVAFVMISSPGSVEFQERVSIATILGSLMSELGLSIQCKKLKITKKGDQGYGKEGTETNRGGSKEKESGRVHQ